MYWLVLIILSLIMAGILKPIFKEKSVSNNYWIWLIVALVGGWLGDVILGNWWWMLAGYNVIAGIIGAFIIGWLYTLIFSQKNQTEDISG